MRTGASTSALRRAAVLVHDITPNLLWASLNEPLRPPTKVTQDLSLVLAPWIASLSQNGYSQVSTLLAYIWNNVM